jgi:adenylate cyclase class IV
MVMHNEIEVKILEIDVEETAKKIEKLGGKYYHSLQIRTIDFDLNQNYYGILSKFIRLRYIWNDTDQYHQYLLVTKYHIECEEDGSKKSTEKEVEISREQFELFEEMFRKSFKILHDTTKKRCSYILDDFLFEMDKIIPNDYEPEVLNRDCNGMAKVESVPFSENISGAIPIFMEIEGPSSEAILEIAKKLGFEEEDLKSWTTPKLLEYYSKEV